MIDFDKDTAFTQKVLDGLAARSKASLHNIANQNTKGFKRFDVHFEDLLREADQRGADFREVKHTIERDTSGPPDANNVVLMEEMALLGKTALLHDAMTRRIGGYMAVMNKSIFGR